MLQPRLLAASRVGVGACLWDSSFVLTAFLGMILLQVCLPIDFCSSVHVFTCIPQIRVHRLCHALRYLPTPQFLHKSHISTTSCRILDLRLLAVQLAKIHCGGVVLKS